MRTISITQDGATQDYQFPDSWADVTVAQFKEFHRVIQNVAGIETIIRTASLFSGIPEAALWEFPQSTLEQLTDAVSFIVKPIENRTVNNLQIDGEEYFVKKDFSQLSIGEVKAIEELMEGDMIDNLNWLLTIMVRRKPNGRWEPVTPELLEQADKFDSLKILDLYGIFEDFHNGVAR